LQAYKKEERTQKLNDIGFEWSLRAYKDEWDERFEQLKAFQKEHGHCRVPGMRDKDSATRTLALWVSKQRLQSTRLLPYKKEERAQKLNDIGFEWSLLAYKDEWDERFEQLKAFQKEHGHCRVPGRIEKDSATKPLALWVSKQRFQSTRLLPYKKEERAQKLNDIGFEWSLPAYKDEWDDRFEQLKDFQKEHGHCRVPVRRDKDSATKPLALWVSRQRLQSTRLQPYKKEERTQKLNDIGFEWYFPTYKDEWDERFEQLKAFQKEHGHCRVPGSGRIDKDSATKPLALWVSKQRLQSTRLHPYKKEERALKLNDIGFEWSLSAYKDEWDERFEQLKDFQKEHGHCRVPGIGDKDSATRPLALWVSRQRFQSTRLLPYKKEERTQKLKDIGFEWSLPAYKDEWDERFEQLKAFQKEHGHCRVPGRRDKDSATKPLALWVARQRLQSTRLQPYKKEERTQKLNDIGFEWLIPRNCK
jgi:hypothetical protein